MDHTGGRFANVPQGDCTVVAIAEGRGSVYSLRADYVAKATQPLTETSEVLCEYLTMIPARRHCCGVFSCYPEAADLGLPSDPPLG
jgi:hypothetical protein